MNKKTMNNIFAISMVFASPKRLLLLDFIKDEPLGYTQIAEKFEKNSVQIGSSEIYKHLKMLIKEGFVSPKYNRYILTKKGMFALKKNW